MANKKYTDEEVVSILKDYRQSGEAAWDVAKRHQIVHTTLIGWIKKAGLTLVKKARTGHNWDKIKKELS